MPKQPNANISPDLADILERLDRALACALPLTEEHELIHAMLEKHGFSRSRPDRQAEGGRRSGLKRFGSSKLKRWNVLAKCFSELPDHFRKHPYSDQTLEHLQRQLAASGHHTAVATIKKDIVSWLASQKK